MTPCRGSPATPPDPLKRAGSECPQVSFRLSAQSPFPNSRETSGNSASAHYQILGVEAPREGEGKGETVQTAWPPSCLYPRFARAPFSVTHASPSPPPRPGLCIARLRWSAGAAPALPWTPELRRECAGASVGGRVRGERRQRQGEGQRFPPLAETALSSRGRCCISVRPPRRHVVLSPARRYRRRCRRAHGVRTPCRPGPRAFSHWRKATAGGLVRDWSVAGRPWTWRLIGRADSGLGVKEELEAAGI